MIIISYIHRRLIRDYHKEAYLFESSAYSFTESSSLDSLIIIGKRRKNMKWSCDRFFLIYFGCELSCGKDFERREFRRLSNTIPEILIIIGISLAVDSKIRDVKHVVWHFKYLFELTHIVVYVLYDETLNLLCVYTID